MKKFMTILCVFTLLAFALPLAGCDAVLGNPSGSGAPSPAASSGAPATAEPDPSGGGASAAPSAAPTETGDDVAKYYPLEEDVRMVYEGKGNEFAFFNAYTEFTGDGRAQIRIDNGGTQAVKVIEVRDDAIVETYLQGEIYYRENMLDKNEKEEILLKLPLEVGNKWTLEDGSERSITGVGVDVETPSGDYQAVEVTTQGEYGSTRDYYAKGLGLIKTVYRSAEGGEDSEISSLLSRIDRGEPYVQIINFYYPSIENESNLLYASHEISFYTNDDTKQILADAYKGEVESGVGKVFSTNTTINSLSLGSDGIVLIDLSKEYMTEMSAGSGFELAMLQCIANTFGQYYNAEKVLLTIDGELYSSGHIMLAEGEYLTVNYDVAKSMTD